MIFFSFGGEFQVFYPSKIEVGTESPEPREFSKLRARAILETQVFEGVREKWVLLVRFLGN